MAPAAPVLSSRYLTFRVGSRHYALPATEVSEVVRIHSLARIPQGPRALLGVANLRGAIVPMVSLRVLLQQGVLLQQAVLLQQGVHPDSTDMLSLVLDQTAPAALVIDAVDSLEEISNDRIEQADEAWQDGEKIRGAFKSEVSRELTKILNIDALLSGAFSERPSEVRRERTAAASSRRAVADQETRSDEMLLTFDIGAQEFAFPLIVVEELLPLPASVSAITRVDTVILGFTSIRDSLIPLLSLRGLLGFDPAAQSTGREKVLILKVAGAPVGLVVDDARAVLSAETRFMEPVPAVLTARTGGETRIRSVYRGDGGRRLISILAPELLFRDEVMQRLAKVEQNVQISNKPEPGLVQAEAIFLVFRLGNDEFGLPIDSVVEVATVPPQITRVPKTPKFLEGVVNLRGDVLPVIDQRRRFEMPSLESETRRLVVMKTAQLRAGIIVDSVADVLRTPADAISPPPVLTSQISRLVYGVVNLETSRRLVLLLDPTELLTRAEQGQLETFQSRRARA